MRNMRQRHEDISTIYHNPHDYQEYDSLMPHETDGLTDMRLLALAHGMICDARRHIATVICPDSVAVTIHEMKQEIYEECAGGRE